MRQLFDEMHVQGATYAEMERDSGVSWTTLLRWRTGTLPTMANLEACLNVLGLKLIAVDFNDDNPPAVKRNLISNRAVVLKIAKGVEGSFRADDIAGELAERGHEMKPGAVHKHLRHLADRGELQRMAYGLYAA